MKEENGIGAGTAIVVVVVLGLLFVSVFVDIVSCPHCGGVGEYSTLFQTFTCPNCGGDGKVTVLQYIFYKPPAVAVI